ncbi:HAD-IC family P-type ATPase [Streptomyces sp. NPDC058304]|uniref:HAD-IC family P-type ATPase n=1 Tax=Streptomyces sp. NPDC058304 TaxID=3346437 RepID=UPI0036EDA39F
MAVTAISLAVAAVPESLPAVVTLALALGARRMAARGALVRRLPAVETLGSVSVLATDKTGTLTEGRMVVQQVWLPSGAIALSGTGYEPYGDLDIEGHFLTAEQLRPVRELLTTVSLCNDAGLRPPAERSDVWTAVGDPMEAALLAAAAKAGCPGPAELRQTHPRTGEVPFDSGRKRMTTVHRTPDGTTLICLKGAPEAVLTPELLDDPSEVLATTRRQAAEMATEGFRVLAVATAERTRSPSAAEAEHGLRLLGLLAISDPPKAAAAATLAACRAAGITPILTPATTRRQPTPSPYAPASSRTARAARSSRVRSWPQPRTPTSPRSASSPVPTRSRNWTSSTPGGPEAP